MECTWASNHESDKKKHGKASQDTKFWRILELPKELKEGKLLHSLAALGDTFKKELHACWKAAWVESPRQRHIAKC